MDVFVYFVEGQTWRSKIYLLWHVLRVFRHQTLLSCHIIIESLATLPHWKSELVFHLLWQWVFILHNNDIRFVITFLFFRFGSVVSLDIHQGIIKLVVCYFFTVYPRSLNVWVYFVTLVTNGVMHTQVISSVAGWRHQEVLLQLMRLWLLMIREQTNGSFLRYSTVSLYCRV